VHTDRASGFVLSGKRYGTSCYAVRADAVSGDVVGRGRAMGQDLEARRVTGVDPKLFLAVNIPGGACGDGEQVRSPWSMALYPGHAGEDPQLRDATCRVGDLSPAQRSVSRCGR
jgi:hypothetical protein